MKIFSLLLCSLGVLLPLSSASAEVGGEQAYQRCAACHMADGSGVPGVFPPLKNRIPVMAASAEGRRYLIMVVQNGLMGNIVVEDISYYGVMPAQSSVYDAKGISVVLNYLAESIDGSQLSNVWQAFTEAEVQQTLLEFAGKKGAQHTAQMRRELFRLHPELNEF